MNQDKVQEGSVGAKLHPQEVKPFFTFIEKAFRAVSLYSENHPLLNQFIKQFADYLNLATQKIQDSLDIRIQQYLAYFGEEKIYEGPKDSSNIALNFYNGGISGLSFLPGIPEEEVKSFLLALWKSKNASSEEESLNTLLWDLELEHILYQSYDELTIYDAEVPNLVDFEERQSFNVSYDAMSSDPARFVEATNFFNLLSEEELETEFTLSETETALLEEDIGLSESPAIQFVWAALQLFNAEQDPNMFTNILRTIKTRLRYEIEEGEFSNGALMIQQIESAKLAFNLNPEFIGELSLLTQNFVDSDLLEHTRKTLAEKEDVNWHAVKCCFNHSNLNLLPELVQFLADPKTAAAFSLVLKDLCQEDVNQLIPFLKNEDANILISLCSIFQELGDRQIFKPLMELIHHKDPRVKDATLTILYQKFPKETADLFITKLNDADKSIRKTARENLPRQENKQVYLKIRSIIDDPNFDAKDLVEKRELFNALAVCGQKEALFILKELISKTVTMAFFRKDAQNKLLESKKCAIRALAHIRDETAKKLLMEVESSKNSELSVLAKIALSEREKLLLNH